MTKQLAVERCCRRQRGRFERTLVVARQAHNAQRRQLSACADDITVQCFRSPLSALDQLWAWITADVLSLPTLSAAFVAISVPSVSFLFRYNHIIISVTNCVCTYAHPFSSCQLFWAHFSFSVCLSCILFTKRYKESNSPQVCIFVAYDNINVGEIYYWGCM